MTDFTDSIERIAEQTEVVATDLEAHLEDILGVDVDVSDVGVISDDGDAELTADVDLPGLEEELNARFEDTDSWFGAKFPDWYLNIELESEPE